MNHVTWQWKDEDIVLWGRAYSQDETYKKQCRQWQRSYAVFGIGVCLLIARMARATWWETALAVILGGALIFGLLELYLRWYTRRAMDQMLHETRSRMDVTDSCTLVVEPDGLRLRMDSSEHWYHWKHFVGASLIHGDFLSITIKGIEEPFYIPPSAFLNPAQRDAFMAQLTAHTNAKTTAIQSGPWWRQRQGNG